MMKRRLIIGSTVVFFIGLISCQKNDSEPEGSISSDLEVSIAELTRNNNLITIDYGDGTYNNKVTVTTNGTTEEISLHTNRFKEGSHFKDHCPGFGEKPRKRHGG